MTPEARAKEVLDKIFGHSRAHGRGELRSVTEAIREATRLALESAAKVLDARAVGFACAGDVIYNGHIMCDELKANARKIRALADDRGTG